MPHFISTEPVRVSLPDKPDEWVEIKPRLSRADRIAILSEIRKVTAVLKGEAGNEGEFPIRVELRMEQIAELVLHYGVVGWHLLDDEGNEVPFSRKMLELSDPEDPLFELVLQELLQRNPTLLSQ